MSDKPKNVLFQFTGSIACFKACDLLSRLSKRGLAVQTVATAGALRFVGAATLEGVTGRPPFTDLYEPGRTMDHIRLARWADLALLCPATAHSMNRLAAGLADDAVGALYLAWEIKAKPYLIAPAMNATMWDHPASRAARDVLSAHGARILPVGDGRLACGEQGEGRLLEVDALEHYVIEALEGRS
ncbi:MAG TPA: flavoprotein [Steroidobacteraceae bacterium]|jgi:phosphopantothenoylcysteine decarboxylase/phosphopantothenate--cysteine ligase|nr:flavoprotein [Steroidobacteraceae bacterium]